MRLDFVLTGFQRVIAKNALGAERENPLVGNDALTLQPGGNLFESSAIAHHEIGGLIKRARPFEFGLSIPENAYSDDGDEDDQGEDKVEEHHHLVAGAARPSGRLRRPLRLQRLGRRHGYNRA